jgi:hypothetical protein
MANSTIPTCKTLAFLGSDRNLATGVLIYTMSCSISTLAVNLLAYKQTLGGIQLPTLEKLEEQDKNSYAKAVQELKNTKKELYFYTKRYRVKTNCHVLVLIVCFLS